jgi:hypothetical protein
VWPQAVLGAVGIGAGGVKYLDEIIWGAVIAAWLLLCTVPLWAPYIGD